jgi:hypothetical protein
MAEGAVKFIFKVIKKFENGTWTAILQSGDWRLAVWT